MDKLIYNFVLFGAILGVISCSGTEPETKPIAPITKIAGSSQGAVAELLGDPVSTTATKNGPKLIYQGEIEVVFIDEKADWITVPMSKVPFA